ncbi:MAG: Holliday junction resolvase RuvX [Candidatus Paceibacterota bacterium]
MRYLGIDYGEKRVGVAVSDAAGTIAFPRMTLTNDASLFEGLEKIISEEKIGTIVVGDTRAFSGLENPVTKDAEAFIGRLAKKTELPVVPAFEAGSSIEASRYSPDGNAHDDGAAAAVILQRYMEMRPDAIK